MSRKCIAILITLFFVCFNVISVSAEVKDKPSIARELYDSKDKVSTKDIEVNQKRTMKFSSSGSIVLDDVAKNERHIVFVLDTSGSLKGVVGDDPSPFDYALFSGGAERFNMQGDSQKVIGKIHANGAVNLSTSNNKYSFTYPTETNPEESKGAIEYIGEATINEKATNNEMFTPGINIDMPELIEVLRRADLMDGGVTVSEIQEFWKGDYKDNNVKLGAPNADKEMRYKNVNRPFNGSERTLPNGTRKVNEYKYNQDMFEITGNGTFKIPDKTIYWFDGPVFFSVNVEFEGTGMIVADGDVIFTGTKITTKSSNPDCMVYAASGNILVLNDTSNFNGILYAPGGAIDFKGANVKVKGSVVAKELNSIPANLEVEYAQGNAKEIVERVDPPVTYSSQMKSVVKNYITDVAKDKTKVTKVGVVKYDVNANDSDEKLYNITDGELDDIVDAIDLIKDQDTGKSNLGDGIRKAYKILDKNNTASKTIIVLSGSRPNHWTAKQGSTTEIYLEKNDVLTNTRFKEDKSEDNFSNRSIMYSKSMSEIAASKGIVPAFINFLEEPKDATAIGYKEKHAAWEKVENSFKEIADEVFDGILNYKDGHYNSNSKDTEPLPLIESLKKNKGLKTLYYKSSYTTLNNDIENIVDINDIDYSIDVTVSFKFKLPLGVKIDEKKLSNNFVPGTPEKDFDSKGAEVYRQVIESNPADPNNIYSISLIGNKIPDPADSSKSLMKFTLPVDFMKDVKIEGLKFILLQKIGKNEKSNLEFLGDEFTMTYSYNYNRLNPISNVIQKDSKSFTINPSTVDYNVFYKVETN
ncbi:vWA domain-containing protein [Pseudobacteroides cellulosolvens]|uniref:Uncharacterized protein n=1 Tax=Pseudobacteroides cellulosolvens ATCC 35603 = DSM 2933 TaxID=398512 RepID=A0A0L6JX26_9FIRM|nr:vWA domain-containing protein [Pseudobacteroides cellulosolvens]KNY30403.1 hypothetical protein Bccel_5683 [Pseudobacteroides cellulosolvens ATCC 35603 = DSM 2933]